MAIQNPKMNIGSSSVLLPLIVIILILLGIFYYFQKKNRLQYNTPQQMARTVKNTSVPQTSATNVMPTSNVKEFTVKGSLFKFNPATITVKKGDLVKINFISEDSLHNLTIDGYGVNTKSVNAGQSDTIQFTAVKTGTFEYYCSVDSHRDRGMVGKFIVE